MTRAWPRVDRACHTVKVRPAVQIQVDDLSGPEIAALLEEHLAGMRSLSPPESVHALPLEGLRSPEVTFWSVWENGELLGCGALKQLDQGGVILAAAHVRCGIREAISLAVPGRIRTMDCA